MYFDKEFDRFRREIEWMFQRMLLPNHPLYLSTTGTWQPATDVYETDHRLHIKVDLAGVPREAISVTLEEGRTLIISGVRRPPQEPNIIYHQVEITYGRFLRRLSLPHEVREEQIQAEYRDGILYITIDLTR